MPLWKRNIIGKKQKKSYSINDEAINDDVNKAPTSCDPVTAPNDNGDSNQAIPEISRNPWIKSHGLKKKSAAPTHNASNVPHRSISTPGYDEIDTQRLDQNSNYNDSPPLPDATQNGHNGSDDIDAENDNPTTKPEVTYGKGFVYRLLQRFKHMTHSEKSRMFDSNQSTPASMPSKSSRPLSSGDLLSANDQRVTSQRRLSDASNVVVGGEQFNRAHSMNDLLCDDPPPAVRPTTFNAGVMPSSSGVVGSTFESTPDLSSKAVSPDPSSSPGLISVSSRRDQYENLAPGVSPVRPPRRLKRQAPPPPTPTSPLPSSLAPHISLHSQKSDSSSSIGNSSLRSISIENTTTESSDEIQTKITTGEVIIVPKDHKVQKPKEVDHIKEKNISKNDPTTNTPMHNGKANFTSVLESEQITTTTPPPTLPTSPPPCEQHKSLTSWLASNTCTDTSDVHLNQHQHPEYIRTESIDKDGHTIGGVCGHKSNQLENKSPSQPVLDAPISSSTLPSNPVKLFKPAPTTSKSTYVHPTPTTKTVAPITPAPKKTSPITPTPITLSNGYMNSDTVTTTTTKRSTTTSTPTSDIYTPQPASLVSVNKRKPESTTSYREPVSQSRPTSTRSTIRASTHGALLIRPASNLTVGGGGSSSSSVSTESAVTTLSAALRSAATNGSDDISNGGSGVHCSSTKQYEDITHGSFAPVRKRPSYYAENTEYSDDDDDDDVGDDSDYGRDAHTSSRVPETNIDDVITEGEVDERNQRRQARSKVNVIGGGITFGRSMLDKTPSRKVFI